MWTSHKAASEIKRESKRILTEGSLNLAERKTARWNVTNAKELLPWVHEKKCYCTECKEWLNGYISINIPQFKA